jgi:hypothetical protein
LQQLQMTIWATFIAYFKVKYPDLFNYVQLYLC